jgi:hypothetical protein
MSRIRFKEKGDQFDTIQIVHDIAFFYTRFPTMQKIASEIHYRHPDNRVLQLRDVFDTSFNAAYYFPDPEEVQQIKAPLRLMRDQFGNCVDYTTFIATLLILLDIPAELKMVKFGEKENYSHIYAITQTTPQIVLDAVIGQDQDGSEVLKGRSKRTSFFNQEEPYYESYLMPIKHENRRIEWSRLFKGNTQS